MPNYRSRSSSRCLGVRLRGGCRDGTPRDRLALPVRKDTSGDLQDFHRASAVDRNSSARSASAGFAGLASGAWEINDVVGISYIRIAIFVLALIFLCLILFVLNRTRLGLEVRAVTQNPGMAASMGINPDRINMLTFGLGSGIAGIAGVAIGLYAKVTSEMGADYIVQSFMTVVVGGVGNVWGTLAGAS